MTWLTCDPIRGQRAKVIVSRPINDETVNALDLPNGRQTNFKLGTEMEYDDSSTSAVTSKVKGQGNKVMSSV